MKICRECEHFQRIANTDECGMGLCAMPDSFFPTKLNDSCHLEPDPVIRCRDCDRLYNDTACLTVDPNDPIEHDNHICGGFIDKHEVAVETAISTWMVRNEDYHAKIEKIINKCKNNTKG